MANVGDGKHDDRSPDTAELAIVTQTRTFAVDRERDDPTRTSAETKAEPDPQDGSDLSREPAAIPGFTILKRVSAGGQGVVYRALHHATKKNVAIKVILGGAFADPRSKARLQRGIRILGQIDHPNIVRILDCGSIRGCLFYAMAYIEGVSLDEWMAASRRSIEESLALFAKICRVVNAAHVRGVIHRDLKPGNIRIDHEGEPHLLDFDLAKLVTPNADEPDADESTARLRTLTGQFVGSLPWASPEQVEGIPNKLDTRTDVYALGVILYQMLTGRFPYDVLVPVHDAMENILHAEPARPSQVRVQINDELETIVLKCLAKERERRYQSPGAVAEDIRRYLANEPLIARRDSTWYLIRKLAARHKYSSAMLVAVAVTILSFAFITFDMYRRMAVEKIRSDRAAETNSVLLQSLQKDGRELRANLAQARFGWFLLEWRSDRSETAKRLRDEAPGGSAERAAMQFLLDPTQSEEPFLAALPAGYDDVGWFVIGERRMKAGDSPNALRAFEECLQVTHTNWYRDLARARTRQLDGVHR